MMIVTAPAKINLTLEVLKKREDGYHEIKSVIQTFNLFDNLKFSAQDRMEYNCNLEGWDASRSLVAKAAELMRMNGGAGKGALIEITKRIPVSSGLGGDSSDAVAALRGLNILWKLNLSLPQLLKLAAELGSDAPLFLYGGTLLAEGRGEKITVLPPMPHASVVILFPALDKIDNKTRELYGQLKARHFTAGMFTDILVNKLKTREKSPVQGLYNVFDQPGLDFFRGLKEHKKIFEDCGAAEVHLAGSGPTLYSLIQDPVQANNVYKKLIDRKMEAYLADF